MAKLIAEETDLALNQLKSRNDFINETPGASKYLQNPLDVADNVSKVSDVAQGLSRSYSQFLETSRFGMGVKVAGNLVAVAGIIANSIEMGNAAAAYEQGSPGAGYQFLGAASGYILGIGLLTANAGGSAAVSLYNPIAAAGGLGIVVSLGIY